jgi:hypothetical protein
MTPPLICVYRNKLKNFKLETIKGGVIGELRSPNNLKIIVYTYISMSNEFDFADYDFADDDFNYVRPPDKPIREILNGNTFNDISNNDISNNDIINNDISNNESNFDAEFEQCLIESQLSFLSEKKRHEEEDEEKEKEFKEKEFKERKLICSPIRNKLERVKGYDIANKEIYETIFSVIDKWELSQIEYFETDKDILESIFNLITSIRMTKDEHKFLINLFDKKNNI